jgi:hypothetical protein
MAARSYGLKGMALRAGVLGLALAMGAWRAPAASPTVVEIFQSQGCSSCPPANENILALVDRPDLLVLSFGVVYWDKLGWKDTFASHANTQRQYDYASGLKRTNVATPEVIINGRIDITGLDRSELNRSIAAAKPAASQPAVSLSGNVLALGDASAPSKGADVWLVRYDPRIVQVPIRAGENTGRTLPHRNVVRELVRLGAWNGKATTFRLPAPTDPAFRTAILVQAVSGGPIITALKP